MLIEIRSAFFKFLRNKPIEERKEYSLHHESFFIRNNKEILLHNQLTPLSFTDDGSVWLLLCTTSPAIFKERGNILIEKQNSNTLYVYDICKHNFEEKHIIDLTNNEKEIIKMSMRGCKTEQMSNDLYRSIESVNKYKKSI